VNPERIPEGITGTRKSESLGSDDARVLRAEEAFITSDARLDLCACGKGDRIVQDGVEVRLHGDERSIIA